DMHCLEIDMERDEIIQSLLNLVLQLVIGTIGREGLPGCFGERNVHLSCLYLRDRRFVEEGILSRADMMRDQIGQFSTLGMNCQEVDGPLCSSPAGVIGLDDTCAVKLSSGRGLVAGSGKLSTRETQRHVLPCGRNNRRKRHIHASSKPASHHDAESDQAMTGRIEHQLCEQTCFPIRAEHSLPKMEVLHST